MKDISIIISTITSSGVKRQKAKINKSKGFITVNGIMLPNIKSFGALNMTTISSVVINPEKWREKLDKHLEKQRLTEIAKKASGDYVSKKTKKRKTLVK